MLAIETQKFTIDVGFVENKEGLYKIPIVKSIQIERKKYPLKRQRQLTDLPNSTSLTVVLLKYKFQIHNGQKMIQS